MMLVAVESICTIIAHLMIASEHHQFSLLFWSRFLFLTQTLSSLSNHCSF